MASRLQKSNIITRLTLIDIATVSQPLLPVLLLDLHIYPVSVFCFLASMSTGGRPHATRQPRGREGLTKTHFTCSGNGGSLFPSSRETENQTQRRRFSGFATRKWGGSRRCFLLIRVYHGLARVHEEKIRFPNRRFSITRLGPSAAKHGRQGKWTNLERAFSSLLGS
jgi:hypothetical protein